MSYKQRQKQFDQALNAALREASDSGDIATNDPNKDISTSFRMETLSIRVMIEDVESSNYLDMELPKVDMLIADLQSQRMNLLRYL